MVSVRAHAAPPVVEWSADLGVGHDDQILAEPVQLGVVRPVADVLFNGSSRFLLRWAGPWKGDRLDVIADVRGVTYGANVDGNDSEVGLATAYRRRLSSAWVLDVAGSGTRLRRGAAVVGDLFNADHVRVDGRLGWVGSPSWLLSVGAQHAWAAYPGRRIPDGGAHEHQGQAGFSLSAVHGLGSRSYVALESLYRITASNYDAADYKGPSLVLRARNPLPAGFYAAPFVAYSQRRYDRYLVPDSTRTRLDRSWQVGATLGKAINSRVSVYLEGSFLHQLSDVSGFEYDQSRASLGVSIDLIPPHRSRHTPPPVSPPLAPQALPGGVRFRFRDPAARSVSVVGGWNGWKAGVDTLSGPGSEGVWEGVVRVGPGIWRYAFVVDGRWITPPGAPRYEDDGFGGKHGIFQVPGG